ncbi:MAG: hypothetical protein HGA25_06645 [Clostridiales bacterium]|nr:hypothetical protein [Clostridiales bacterium]
MEDRLSPTIFLYSGLILPHDLLVELDNSMFPIMGNTEEVKNSQNSEDQYDDATKVNEYASWYLSGVNNKKEYGESTDEQIVNFSGPVNKLLPKLIQEAERIKTIIKANVYEKWTDEETGDAFDTPQNHDQIVVCESFGKSVECPSGSELRLSDWGQGNLSLINTFFNWLGTDIWDHRYPPLPWQFEKQILYQKAYNEWQGKSCASLPNLGLQCIDTPVPNKWANLYQYIPLSNTTDKKGAEYQLGDGPSITPDANTEITGAQFKQIRNAPLYFAHTQEVKELSELLNKTYNPQECVTENGNTNCEPLENKPLPKTTETNECSVANVRVNKGDDLFPGDPDEMQVNGVKYTITQATCHEKFEMVPGECCEHAPNGQRICDPCMKPKHTFKCPATVTVKIRTGTKTPSAEEIFSTTVADSGSTFRKIFPKVESGAPASCIADIPTVTDVTYEGSNTLTQGESEFKVGRYPEDGAGGSPQLTFPHVGSVYEYFLKGIQTALRPKGYGEPITDGTLCNNVECGELPELPKASGSCNLGSISSRVGNIPQSLKDT